MEQFKELEFGETIENKIERMMNNNEPIGDIADIIYTERKDGVLPEYDIRTDKWDLAIDAMNQAHKQDYKKRADRLKEADNKPAETTLEGGEETVE